MTRAKRTAAVRTVMCVCKTVYDDVYLCDANGSCHLQVIRPGVVTVLAVCTAVRCSKPVVK